MLGYFNRTHCELSGTWKYYKPLMYAEVVLIFMSTIYMIFWIYVINTAQSLHRNVRLLHSVYYSQYVVQTIFWIFQPIIILSGSMDDVNLVLNKIVYITPSNMFMLVSVIRSTGLMYAFYTLPGFVIERSFATYMVQDYENNPYPEVGNSIILIQALTALGLGTSFNIASSTVPHTILAIVVNNLAVLLNFYIAYVNKKYYNTEFLTYSLSQRFQITENIRTSKMFNKIVYCISIFNVIANSCMILDNYDIPMEYKNLTCVLCDFSILCYGFTVAYVTYLQEDSWIKRVNVLLGRFGSQRVLPAHHDHTISQTIEPKNKETSVHFDMLKSQWK